MSRGTLLHFVQDSCEVSRDLIKTPHPRQVAVFNQNLFILQSFILQISTLNKWGGVPSLQPTNTPCPPCSPVQPRLSSNDGSWKDPAHLPIQIQQKGKNSSLKQPVKPRSLEESPVRQNKYPGKKKQGQVSKNPL